MGLARLSVCLSVCLSVYFLCHVLPTLRMLGIEKVDNLVGVSVPKSRVTNMCAIFQFKMSVVTMSLRSHRIINAYLV